MSQVFFYCYEKTVNRQVNKVFVFEKIYVLTIFSFYFSRNLEFKTNADSEFLLYFILFLILKMCTFILFYVYE